MDTVEYVLRIWYAQFDTSAKVRGVIEFCRKAGIRKIQISPTDGWVQALSTQAQIVAHCRKLKKILKMLRAGDIEPGYNVGRTFFAGSSVGKDYIGFKQPRVAMNGIACPLLPCPLDRIYLDYTRFFYAELARTGPSTILPDDDYRYEYLGTGPTCFCPLHLKEFKWRYGHKVDREKLVKILEDAAAHEIKNDWMEFKRILLVELARELRQAVHEVNPGIRMGLMLTSTEIAAYEGRDPWELVKEFAGDHKPLVRMGQGCYQDGERLGLMDGLIDTVYQAGLMSEDTEKQAEVDFYPHTTFAKSAHFGFDYQIKANLAFNLRTINILPFGRDNKVDKKHPFAAVMARNIKIFNRIARQIPSNASLTGVQVIYSQKAARLRAQTSAAPYPPPPMSPVAEMLWRWGLPFSFSEQQVAVLTRDSFPMTKADAERILREKHLFMDADALALIKSMGFKQVSDIDFPDSLPLAALIEEQILPDIRNGGAQGFRFSITSRMSGARHGKQSNFLRLRIPARSGWRALTLLGGNELGRGYPGMLAGEINGRRILISATRLMRVAGNNPVANNYWANETRQSQMQSAFAWLCGGVLPAVVRNAPDICPILLENGSSTRILNLINLSTGCGDEATVEIAAPSIGKYQVEFIDDNGTSVPLEQKHVSHRNGALHLRLAGKARLYPYHVRFIIVRKS